MIRAKEAASAPVVDLTPVIDMVFLLLIFFLVATTFQQIEREMNVVLPSAAAATPISAALRELVINVNSEGQIIVAGKRLEPDELSTMVKTAVAGNPNQKVSVRGDRTTAYSNIVRVLDICKAGGIQEPYLDTVHAK